MKRLLLAALLAVAVSGGAVATEHQEDTSQLTNLDTISILEAGPSFVIPVTIDGAVLAIYAEKDCTGCHARAESSLAVIVERLSRPPNYVVRQALANMANTRQVELEYGDRQVPWLPPNWRTVTYAPGSSAPFAADISHPLLM